MAIRATLQEHFEELTAACTALRLCVTSNEHLVVIARCQNLERALVEHLRIEAQMMLPEYAMHAPAEAASIQRMHERLRADLLRLGASAELRVLRADAVEHLVASIADLAVYESHTLHAWADEHLDGAMQRDLFRRISRSLRSLTLFVPQGGGVTQQRA